MFDRRWNLGWCSWKSNDLLTTTPLVDYIWQFQLSKLFQPFQSQGGAIAIAVTYLDTCVILFSFQNTYGRRKMFGKPMTVWVVYRHFVSLSFEKILAGLLQNLLFFLDGKWLGQPCCGRLETRLYLDLWQRVNKKKKKGIICYNSLGVFHTGQLIDRKKKRRKEGLS